MSTKAARGIKRTCQSNECGARFYDLNRDPIACPICGTIYQIAHATGPISAAMIEEKPRKPKKELVAEKELAPEAAAEGEEALADIEEAEDIPADDDETFLEEEEEEGGDVSNIIGGPVAEGEEEV
jgi:uncharacterized protein (TIGR02300 family)